MSNRGSAETETSAETDGPEFERVECEEDGEGEEVARIQADSLCR